MKELKDSILITRETYLMQLDLLSQDADWSLSERRAVSVPSDGVIAQRLIRSKTVEAISSDGLIKWVWRGGKAPIVHLKRPTKIGAISID